MTQFSGLWFSDSLRPWSEASSSIALRARAASREVSQLIAAQERVEARIGRRYGHRTVEVARHTAYGCPLHQRSAAAGAARPHKFCITASPRRPAPSARWCHGRNSLANQRPTPKKTGCASDKKSFKWSVPATIVKACLQQALANQSLNRTFCGIRPLGFISFSALRTLPQTAG